MASFAEWRKQKKEEEVKKASSSQSFAEYRQQKHGVVSPEPVQTTVKQELPTLSGGKKFQTADVVGKYENLTGTGGNKYDPLVKSVGLDMIANGGIDALVQAVARQEEADRQKQMLIAADAQRKGKTTEEQIAEAADLAGKTVWSGIGQLNKGVTSTLAFAEGLISKPIDKAFGDGEGYKNWPLYRLNEHYSDIDEQFEAERQAALEDKGIGAQLASEVGKGAVAAVPQALLALATGGGSAATQIGTANAGLAASVGESLRAMVKSPAFIASVTQTLGPAYEEELANGANDLQAAAAAIISTALNAGVEIGGGLETLPANIRSGGRSAIGEWVKSMLDEGKEEVIQGVISGITSKALSDPNKEIASWTNEEAIINPGRMAKEFGLGAAVGGLLGGAQIGAMTALNPQAQTQERLQDDVVTEELIRNLPRRSEQTQEPSAPKIGAEIAAEMGIGKNGAEAAQQAGITPENVGAFTAYYDAGKDGKAIEEVKTIQTGIDENTARQAYNAGQMDALAEVNTEQEVTENEGREIRLRGISERLDGENSGGQIGSVVESTRGDQRRETEGGPETGGADSLQIGRKTVTTGSQGIVFGSTKDAIRMVTGGDNQYTEEAKKMARERGLRVQFFVGNNMTIRNTSVRGYISGDRVFIRADHPTYTPDQIMRHEVGHDMIAKGDVDVEIVRSRLREKYNDEQLSRIAELYALALSDSNMTADQIWEEIICDSLGDMNVFAESGVGGAFGELLSDTKSAAFDNGKASAEPKYSYASLTSKPDMNLTLIVDTKPYEITRDNKNEIRRQIVKDAVKNASRIGKTNETGGVSVYVNDIGEDVVLSTHGLKHGLDRRLESSAPVVLQAGEIIKNAVRINENTPKDKNADYGYVLLGAARNKSGDPYIVRFIVNGYTNAVDSMDVMYAMHTKKEPAALLPAITDESATLTDSKISIAQILDLASKYFPEVLPESALRHYGFDSRPSGELGESMLYSEDVSDEAVRKALEQYIDKYGAIEPGENPFRTVQVPKKTGENKNVSKTVRTILEAQATPDAAIPTIEQMVESGDLSYETISDKQAIANARAKLTTKGWSKTFSKWMEEARTGTVSKDHTVTGWALYNNAANAGDLDIAMTVLEEMVKSQRNAAQALQATRVLKKLSPEAQLYAAQRSVEDLQEEINERYGSAKAPQISIDPDLAQAFMAAKTEGERTAAMAEIYKDVGRQMPSTFRDKWNAWRYLAMLGNPRTHVRNIVGNAGFAPVVAAKNLTATAIEKAVNVVSGGKTGRSKAIIGIGKTDRAILKAAWGDYAKVQDQIMSGGKYSDFQMASQAIEEGRRIFKAKALEAARRGNTRAMEAEDAWFSKPHYAYALAGYCKANGITPAMIEKGASIETARAYAIREAQKATYRDTNAFSQMVSDLGKVNKNEKNIVKKGVGVVLQGILPFRKTPANILVRGVEYSPIGLMKAISADAYKVAKGDMSATEMIDNLSAGLTGTGLLAMGAFLAAQGLIRGHGSDDEKKEFEELQGHQAYSLEIGDTSITLDWLAPECLPFFVGVNLYEQSVAEGEDMTMSTMLSAIQNVSEPMLEMSCLQSLNDVFDAVGYASSNDLAALPSILASSATSYLTQGLPTLLGQAERSGQDVRYTTYTTKDSFLTSDMQYTLGSASARIPGWDYNQIPYIDAWGRQESSGGVVGRSFNNFLNPSYTSTITDSKMEDELMRLYDETGEGSVFPTRAQRSFPVGGETKYLTADEYVKYATQKGQVSYELVNALQSFKVYDAMSDEERVDAISDAYQLANVVAKHAVSGYTTTGWMEKAVSANKKAGISYAKYLEVRLNVSGIESIKDADGESISNSKGLQIMEAIYNMKGLNDKQRRQLFEDFGVGKTIIDLNKAAVEAKLKNMR